MKIIPTPRLVEEKERQYNEMLSVLEKCKVHYEKAIDDAINVRKQMEKMKKKWS